MKCLVIFICSLFALVSCSESERQENLESIPPIDNYDLIEVDAYSFRRAYYSHDTLEGDEVDLFINRNPEPLEEYKNSNNHPFLDDLSEIGLIQHGNLNMTELDTLPDLFSYQAFPNKFFNVKKRLLLEPEQVKTPSYELTFEDEHKIVLIDTLEFDWPPDVTFIKMDLDKNGTEELLSIYRWYIMNGDNFDLKIYTLKK